MLLNSEARRALRDNIRHLLTIIITSFVLFLSGLITSCVLFLSGLIILEKLVNITEKTFNAILTFITIRVIGTELLEDGPAGVIGTEPLKDGPAGVLGTSGKISSADLEDGPAGVLGTSGKISSADLPGVVGTGPGGVPGETSVGGVYGESMLGGVLVPGTIGVPGMKGVGGPGCSFDGSSHTIDDVNSLILFLEMVLTMVSTPAHTIHHLQAYFTDALTNILH